jgi:hypothetical protein
MAKEKQPVLENPQSEHLEMVAEIVGRAPALTDDQRARISGMLELSRSSMTPARARRRRGPAGRHDQSRPA